MKVRSKKEYSSNWVQTVVSIVGLLFALLVTFGVITPEQSATATPIIATTLGAVSSAIAGVIALIGIFFKPSE
jgi:protein-S-isoprenylcysteine O-methyltransferase Ste14